jgi:acyl carrier protein
MVPVAYAFLDEWPLTPNGKLDLQRLPPAVRVDADGGLRAAPADQLEEALCRLFEQTLRVEEVGVEDDFFDRGGHSLLATQLLTRIRDAFDVELPLRTLFERRTVAGIAGELRGQARSPEALVEAAGMLLHVLSLSDEDVEALLGAGDPGSRA